MNIQLADVEKATLKICNGCLKKWTKMCDVNDIRQFQYLQVAWEALVWSLLTGLYYEVLVNWYCHLALV